MNIRLFLELSKEFFDSMYSPFIGDIVENGIIKEKIDEEKGCEELSDNGNEKLADYNLYNFLCRLINK